MAAVILAEQTLNFSDANGAGIYEPFDNYPAVFPLVTGEMYTVVWDGVEYACTAKDSQEYADLGGVCIGNETITNNDDGYTDTGEPFRIIYSLQMNMNVISTKETAETHTVAIYYGKDWPNGYLAYNLTVQCSPDGAVENAYSGSLVVPAIIAAGNQYTVVWDGESYVCAASAVQIYGADAICLGNKSIIEDADDTGEPFCYLYVPSFGMGIVNTLSKETEHVVSVYDGVLEEDGGGEDGYLLKDQTLAFELETNSETVYYNNEVAPAITTGNTYTVIWDGDYYKCVAKEWTGTQGDVSIDFIVLGNLNIRDTAEENTGEPFFYMYAPAFTSANFLTLETDASHVVSLYDGVLEKPVPETVNLVLLDRNGNPVTYEGIKTVSFNTADGKIATFTLSAISSN